MPEKLKVFTFDDVAYQVDARARLCSVAVSERDDLILEIKGRTAALAKGNPGDAFIYQAWRLSIASEWFDLTLRKAAHDYLDATLDAHRVYIRGGDSDTFCEASGAVDWIALVYARGSLLGAGCGLIRDIYSARVKADIEARLMGESGEVQRP